MERLLAGSLLVGLGLKLELTGCFPSSFPEEAGPGVLGGQGQEDPTDGGGGRPQRSHQVAQKRAGNQTVSQVSRRSQSRPVPGKRAQRLQELLTDVNMNSSSLTEHQESDAGLKLRGSAPPGGQRRGQRCSSRPGLNIQCKFWLELEEEG